MNIRIFDGKDRGHRGKTARGSGLRPTTGKVRAAIFSILGPDLEGSRVLDMYAGTGALGIEALKRGADWVDFVDVDEHRCRHIRQTLKDMNMDKQARVYKARAERSFDRLQGGYDIVFADPPYEHDPWDELLERFGYADFLKPETRVVAEHRSKTVLRDTYGRLNVESRRKYGDTAVTFFRLGKISG